MCDKARESGIHVVCEGLVSYLDTKYINQYNVKGKNKKSYSGKPISNKSEGDAADVQREENSVEQANCSTQ